MVKVRLVITISTNQTKAIILNPGPFRVKGSGTSKMALTTDQTK